VRPQSRFLIGTLRVYCDVCNGEGQESRGQQMERSASDGENSGKEGFVSEIMR